MRSVIKKDDGKKELAGEYGRGDLIGVVSGDESFCKCMYVKYALKMYSVFVRDVKFHLRKCSLE